VRARPPRPGDPAFDAFLAGWTGLHGGYRPMGLVRGYLRVIYAAAQPLRGFPPDVLTGAGLLIALTALLPARLGGAWAVLAALLVAASGLADSLDGAVAVLAGRATRWGYVLDSVADRAGDLAHIGVLWLLGAPGWLCATAGAALFLLEYTRARAIAAGMEEVGVVTMGERPTRIVVGTVFLLCGAAVDPVWYDLGTAAIAGLSLLGLGQLFVAVRRRLRPGPPGP
jgi:CDP-diacylglycerol--glycerol-3-phosphate 3-phosphatidyltransferase